MRVRNAAMSLLMRSPRLRDRVYRRELLPGMVRPFERLFERGGGDFERSWSMSPAIRISKNSSRFVETMQRNFSLSSSGIAGSLTWCSTR